MPKRRRRRATVGAYLLRKGADDNWETLVHRRSGKVSYGQGLTATPGGYVDRSDCIDENFSVDTEIGYYYAMLREVYEETSIQLDSMDPANVEALDPSPVYSNTHRNFFDYLEYTNEVRSAFTKS